ncbi:PP2C family protein-serine/threonine phosphatase [Actinoplanes sp. CA-030573]|uniref:PP2C family protein-serine/threonine phosphatase n=1 Tax=Actinoplanes sp. CA-030573 TaxID=3239898 RepID=UPI003D947891
MDHAATTRWFDALGEILGHSHRWSPDAMASWVAAAAVPLGLRTTIWLVDYEQVSLRALAEPGRPAPPPMPIAGTLAGRAFARVESLAAGTDERQWWIPMVDGTDRLGVLEVVRSEAAGPADSTFRQRCELLAGLVGHLVTTTSERGDHLDRARRSAAMSPGAEMLWRMLPPLTATGDGVVVSAVLQPCYDVGGDGFDYTLENGRVNVAIFDAVGKGLPAALTCSVALAAIRAARRAGQGLGEQARAADDAVAEQFPDARFVTAVLAELDLASGRLSYLNAGHPPPMVLRRGRAVHELGSGRRLPLGLGDRRSGTAELILEPGDRLLCYTDGVTEARTPDGDRFGLTRLIHLIDRHAGSGLPVPEVLRRLAHAVLEHQGGPRTTTPRFCCWNGPPRPPATPCRTPTGTEKTRINDDRPGPDCGDDPRDRGGRGPRPGR